MAIPDYADPRSHEHFHRYYVGNKGGDNGTDYRTGWDTRSDAKPTTVFRIGPGTLHCVYCGNPALFIQDGRFEVTGHTCCCTGAMDELEWIDRYEALLDRQARELSEMKGTLPKTSDAVVRARIAAISKEMVEDITRQVNCPSHQPNASTSNYLDIKVTSPARELIDRHQCR